MNAYENTLPAPWAAREDCSLGRRHAEPADPDESPFEVDRHRILCCTAFRRLMHKTQVFVTDQGDHFRTRLTHTLEVAEQAQRLARRLGLNEPLAGAIALAHDLGHPPFGHAGEAALAELMAGHGGFEHNIQSLRVVDYLEHPFPAFRGLNLSFELRESLVKHRTGYDRPDAAAPVDPSVQELLAGGSWPPLEGQVANLADAVAYTLHDIEDGLLDGALDESILAESTLWREAAAAARAGQGQAPVHAVRRPVLDEMARRLVADAAGETRRRIAALGIACLEDARRAPEEAARFSPAMAAVLDELGRLLRDRVYQNHRVVRMDSKARRLIRDLFQAYQAEPQLLPARFQRRLAEQGAPRVICDYIAGMTDRFCQEEHQRLYAPFHFG
jgi:dGTPase